MRIRTLDPAFYLNADPDLDPGSQSNADPDPGHTLKSKKVEFFEVPVTRGRYRDTVVQKTYEGTYKSLF